MRKTLLPLLGSFMLLLPNFFTADINPVLPFNGKERYKPELSRLNSVYALTSYTDSIARAQGVLQDSAIYADLLAQVVSDRFFHGFSHFTTDENWIAALGERITGVGLSCKVQPEEIIKEPRAACSQQALVMMEVLRAKGIAYRKVGFPHHYALEIRAGNKWHYQDPNMEPMMMPEQRLQEAWAGQNDRLKVYYDTAIHRNLDYQFGRGQRAEFGPVNEVPAPRLRLFQSATAIASKTLWMLPLLALWGFRRRENK